MTAEEVINTYTQRILEGDITEDVIRKILGIVYDSGYINATEDFHHITTHISSES